MPDPDNPISTGGEIHSHAQLQSQSLSQPHSPRGIVFSPSPEPHSPSSITVPSSSSFRSQGQGRAGRDREGERPSWGTPISTNNLSTSLISVAGSGERSPWLISPGGSSPVGGQGHSPGWGTSTFERQQNHNQNQTQDLNSPTSITYNITDANTRSTSYGHNHWSTSPSSMEVNADMYMPPAQNTYLTPSHSVPIPSYSLQPHQYQQQETSASTEVWQPFDLREATHRYTSQAPMSPISPISNSANPNPAPNPHYGNDSLHDQDHGHGYAQLGSENRYIGLDGQWVDREAPMGINYDLQIGPSSDINLLRLKGFGHEHDPEAAGISSSRGWPMLSRDPTFNMNRVDINSGPSSYIGGADEGGMYVDNTGHSQLYKVEPREGLLEQFDHDQEMLGR